jgi:hypothetical protein
MSRTRGRDVALVEDGKFPATFTFEFASHEVYDFELNIDGTTALGRNQAMLIAEALADYFGSEILAEVAAIVAERETGKPRPRPWATLPDDAELN